MGVRFPPGAPRKAKQKTLLLLEVFFVLPRGTPAVLSEGEYEVRNLNLETVGRFPYKKIATSFLVWLFVYFLNSFANIINLIKNVSPDSLKEF
jgi:hypothetical protein